MTFTDHRRGDRRASAERDQAIAAAPLRGRV